MVVEDIHTHRHGSGKKESSVSLSWWNYTGVTLKLEKERALHKGPGLESFLQFFQTNHSQ